MHSRGHILRANHPPQSMNMKHWVTIALAAFALAGSAVAAEPAKKKAAITKPDTATTKPLTFENVRRFFSDTLRIRPKEVQKRCALFYEGEWKDANTYHYCVIIVENSDEDLQVTFYITDDREMNWVNEFLDGPFFNRKETEQLFGLLHAKTHVRGQKIGRYRVDVSHWEPRHAEIIVFSFTGVQPRRN